MIFKVKVFLLRCCLAVILGGTSLISLASLTVPPEVEVLIPTGTNLIDYQVADLNADGRIDTIIVVEKINKNDEFGQEPRTVMILIRSLNGELKIIENNNKTYLCEWCLGGRNDSEQYLTVGKGTFEIHNHGGSTRYRRYQNFMFKYNPKIKTWFLYKVETSISDEADETDENHERSKSKLFTYPKNLKKIKFSQFIPNTNWNAKF